MDTVTAVSDVPDEPGQPGSSDQSDASGELKNHDTKDPTEEVSDDPSSRLSTEGTDQQTSARTRLRHPRTLGSVGAIVVIVIVSVALATSGNSVKRSTPRTAISHEGSTTTKHTGTTGTTKPVGGSTTTTTTSSSSSGGGKSKAASTPPTTADATPTTMVYLPTTTLPPVGTTTKGTVPLALPPPTTTTTTAPPAPGPGTNCLLTVKRTAVDTFTFFFTSHLRVGVKVTFNGTGSGSAVTDSSGTAVWTYEPPFAPTGTTAGGHESAMTPTCTTNTVTFPRQHAPQG